MGLIVLPGDIIFEQGSDFISRSITAAQRVFCKGIGDPEATHVAIVIAPFLIFEADPEQQISLRAVKEKDADTFRYIFRPRCPPSVASLHSTTRFFMAERYSYYKIILSRLQDTDMASSLGTAFCSGLVKRFLTIVGLADGLNDRLLESPCELYAELEKATDQWMPIGVSEYRQIIGSSNLKLALESADLLKNSFYNQVSSFLNLAMFGYLVANHVTDQRGDSDNYPFDARAVAGRIFGLEALSVASAQKLWMVEKNRTKCGEISANLARALLDDAVNLTSIGEKEKQLVPVMVDKLLADTGNLLNCDTDIRDKARRQIVTIGEQLGTLPIAETLRCYSYALGGLRRTPLEKELLEGLQLGFDYRTKELIALQSINEQVQELVTGARAADNGPPEIF